MKTCIDFMVGLTILEGIILLVFGVSRNILGYHLKKNYPDEIPKIFKGHSHPNDFPRTYGIGSLSNFIKFEKMIYNNDKIICEGHEKITLVASISGFMLYSSIIIYPIIFISCANRHKIIDNDIKNYETNISSAFSVSHIAHGSLYIS